MGEWNYRVCTGFSVITHLYLRYRSILLIFRSFKTFLEPANHFKTLDLINAYAISDQTDYPPSVQLVESVARQIIDTRTKYTKPSQVYDWWYNRGLPDPDDVSDANDGSFETQNADDRADGEEESLDSQESQLDTEEEKDVVRPQRRKVGEVDMSHEAVLARKKGKEADALVRQMFGGDDESSEEEPLIVTKSRGQQASTTPGLQQKPKVYVSGKLVADVEMKDTIIVQPRLHALSPAKPSATKEDQRHLATLQVPTPLRKIQGTASKQNTASKGSQQNLNTSPESDAPIPSNASFTSLFEEEDDSKKPLSKPQASPTKKPGKQKKSDMAKFMGTAQDDIFTNMRKPVTGPKPLPTSAVPFQALTPMTQKRVETLHHEPRVTAQELARIQHGLAPPHSVAIPSPFALARQQAGMQPKMTASTKKAVLPTKTTNHKENNKFRATQPIPSNPIQLNPLHYPPVSRPSVVIPSQSALGKHLRPQPSVNNLASSTTKDAGKGTRNDNSPPKKKVLPNAGVTGYTGSANRIPARKSIGAAVLGERKN